MGTLVNSVDSNSSSRRKVKSQRETPSHHLSEKDLKKYEKLEKKLEKEYLRIRGDLEDIRQAFRYLEDATSHDDIYFRLLALEKTTSQVRKGTAFSKGAKIHRKLLSKLHEFPIE